MIQKKEVDQTLVREALESLQKKGFVEIFDKDGVEMVRLTPLGEAQAEFIMQLFSADEPRHVIN